MIKYCSLLSAITLLLACQTAPIKNNENNTAIGCMPKTTDIDWYSNNSKAPILPGLEGITLPVSTSNKEAKKYFYQGMMLSYGFNHAEAARSFFESTRIDSNFAMGYWGLALVLGPNYNAGMEPDNFQRAYAASQKALQLKDNCTSLEIALIEAMVTRYEKEPPADRKPLDIAFNTAMKAVFEKFPKDPDVGALYAESLMDLHPWDLYEKKTKIPREWTPELVQVLEQLMQENPRHPGAHHYYIHALEASANPEKATASAALLASLVPGSGHLLHMSSHIYINTGDYHLGSLSNIAAVKIDSAYLTACHAQGAYPLSYYPHNYHFLVATATLEGNSTLAMEAAFKVQEKTAKDIMLQPGWGTLQHYFTIPYYVAVKFKKWDTILAAPIPAKELIYPAAILHYARGLAFIGKGKPNEAEKELKLLEQLSTDSSLKTLTIWGINTTADIVQIAAKVLAGELAYAKNDPKKAMKLLSEAITIEDQLNYDEPPDWFFSVRHHLGAIQLKQGLFAEAEKIYKEDLQVWKKNGWALVGLCEALKQQRKTKEYESANKEFSMAWKYSDVLIRSSSPIN